MITLILRDLLRAAVRIERKLDELLRAARLQNPQFMPLPLHTASQVCPLCQRQIVYASVLLDGGYEVVRICGCIAVPEETAVNQVTGG